MENMTEIHNANQCTQLHNAMYCQEIERFPVINANIRLNMTGKFGKRETVMENEKDTRNIFWRRQSEKGVPAH